MHYELCIDKKGITSNKNSKTTTIVVVFFGVAIIVVASLCFVLKIVVSVDYDFIKNSGAVIVRLFFVKILERSFSFDLETLQIKFRKKGDKNIKEDKKVSKKTKNSNSVTHNSQYKGSLTLKYLIRLALEKIEIRNLDISLLAGIKNDAAATCIILGVLQNSIYGLGAVFAKKYNTRVFVNAISTYNENALKVNALIKNYICLARIIKALFMLLWHKLSRVVAKARINKSSKKLLVSKRGNTRIYGNNR